MKRFVVIGGSSPFTAALIEALADPAARLPAHRLTLCGRTETELELMRGFAARRLEPLGWSVEATTRLGQALDGAELVLHQNRYGGMAGRAQDEAVAAEFGVGADETLGPAALNSMLRSLPDLKRMGELLARSCPEAWVLNLTNPLSLATAELVQQGVARCIGLCELPRVTAHSAAGVIGLAPEQVQWSYAGFNHRGFIVEFQQTGRDLIDDLARVVGETGLAGVPGQVIAALRVVPTKYFRQMLQPPAPAPSRAAVLAELRDRILSELRAGEESPPSLSERYTEWYPQSVVPLIAALSDERESEHVVNLADPDGLVRERHAAVSKRGVRPLEIAQAPPEAGRWLMRFERHERCLLEAMRYPNSTTLHRALESDPSMPAGGEVLEFVPKLIGGKEI